MTRSDDRPGHTAPAVHAAAVSRGGIRNQRTAAVGEFSRAGRERPHDLPGGHLQNLHALLGPHQREPGLSARSHPASVVAVAQDNHAVDPLSICGQCHSGQEVEVQTVRPRLVLAHGRTDEQHRMGEWE